MKHWLKRTLPLTLALSTSMFVFTSCEDGEINLDDVAYAFGWFENENTAEIESDLNLGANSGSLPSKVDLLSRFPPIGNQGAYGTCVAWSLGYNLKTALEAVDREWTASQLQSEANQFSPKDLFWSIPSSEKGGECNGTYFEAAFDVMQSRGIARMSTVPYTSLGDCSSSPNSTWTSEANNFKIDSYRKINMDVQEIKGYLSQGRPVAFGAKLGEGFMQWNSSAVIDSDGIPNNGQHGYHAMIIGGYDDSKGANGAFKVVNSWGRSWGDNGYIWVDYNFFVNDFCFAAFVAKNKRGDNYDPDQNDDGNVDAEDQVSGKDLVAWELTDHKDAEGGSRDRVITYNVYNVGNEAIRASEDWSIAYIYYNAYNADDWGILLYDYYSNDYGSLGEDGELTGGPAISGNWWNNVDVPSGMSVVQALFGSNQEGGFRWGYRMPSTVSGKYYLALIADAYDVVSEHDETNNFYFFSKANGDPIQINSGVISDEFDGGRNGRFAENPEKGADSPHKTVRTANNLNTYSTEEIKAMILHHKETGELDRRIQKFIKEKGAISRGLAKK